MSTNQDQTIFQFSNPSPSISEIEWLRTGFGKILNNMKGQAVENDQLGFTLQNLNLKSKDPGYVAFRPVSKIDDDILWEMFGGTIQISSE